MPSIDLKYADDFDGDGKDGGPLPSVSVPTSLVLTADASSFLVFGNYETLLAYNCSHYYALSVSLLADAIS
jgi:membrane-bound lytic murein transglycosylase B